ncbi:MAG: hypothetical protein A3A86_03050 [Elusimicrobia bacterium RIFCSPLOWO2_01_FULL_60_11]|nr:MAG: hypothetical protein A3A86_03050 [Elusimicrobia bacterium RIFCSPLOWO2_01_FULL_60_11]
MTKQLSNGYKTLLLEIKSRIRSAQYEALKAVNKELIGLYWDIGRMIVSRQKGRSWGRSIVQKLARDLQAEFPGMRGFSSQNLWYMRQFYAEYHGNQNLQPLVGEISWTKHIVILAKCKDPLEREFYIRMARKMGWSKNVLIHQVENKSYEKTLLNQTNFNRTLPDKIRNQAKLAVKDEYSFDFLELMEDHSEMELERALMAKINRFLIEMGGVFSFMGNQFRLEINGNEFYVDILLYHRRLKCLVAIELKAGVFRPEHAGKMQFYLAALDDRVKMREENPSIGIILCKSKDKTIVEYALKNTRKPIGVATYRIVSVLPKELRGQLPAPNQVKKLLSDLI